MRPCRPEAGDRAVDGGLRDVVRADAQPVATPGRKLSRITSARARGPANGRSLFRSIATDSLPAFSASSQAGRHRASGRRPAARGARPARRAEQLAGRKRPRQVAGHVDDEHPCERLHSPNGYYSAGELRPINQPRRLRGQASVTRPSACSPRRATTRAASPTSPRRRASRTGCSTTTSSRRKRCCRPSFGRTGASCSSFFHASRSPPSRRWSSSERSPRCFSAPGATSPTSFASWCARSRGARSSRSRWTRSAPSSSSSRVIERGQADGSFRPELDARLASWIFYGGLEELLTGWVLGQLPDGDEAVARAEQTVVDLLSGGLTRAGAAASTSKPLVR